MNIHEYQAKEILKKFGIEVPSGIIILKENDVTHSFESFNSDVYVVKAQIHAGGRGKAGGVKITKSKEEAIDLAKEVGARVTGIVGRDGGYTAINANVCLIVPTVNPDTVTPHAESFQAVIWHLLVSHPKLKTNSTKW